MEEIKGIKAMSAAANLKHTHIMIDSILQFMDAANKADRKLGYELAIAQNISIEKILRAWLEKRFQVLKELKNKGICSFVAVSGGVGFELKYNNDMYIEFIQTLNKYNIDHRLKFITLKGFLPDNVLFFMDMHDDNVSELAQKHNNIDALKNMTCEVKIPQYLF